MYIYSVFFQFREMYSSEQTPHKSHKPGYNYRYPTSIRPDGVRLQTFTIKSYWYLTCSQLYRDIFIPLFIRLFDANKLGYQGPGYVALRPIAEVTWAESSLTVSKWPIKSNVDLLTLKSVRHCLNQQCTREISRISVVHLCMVSSTPICRVYESCGCNYIPQLYWYK